LAYAPFVRLSGFTQIIDAPAAFVVSLIGSLPGGGPPLHVTAAAGAKKPPMMRGGDERRAQEQRWTRGTYAGPRLFTASGGSHAAARTQSLFSPA